jgi:uncharacterized membrane protein SirB2
MEQQKACAADIHIHIHMIKKRAKHKQKPVLVRFILAMTWLALVRNISCCKYA